MENIVQTSQNVTVSAPTLFFGFLPKRARPGFPLISMGVLFLLVVVCSIATPTSAMLFVILSVPPGIMLAVKLVLNTSFEGRSPRHFPGWENVRDAHFANVQSWIAARYGVAFPLESIKEFWEGDKVTSELGQVFQLENFEIHRQRGEFGHSVQPLPLVLLVAPSKGEDFAPVNMVVVDNPAIIEA